MEYDPSCGLSDLQRLDEPGIFVLWHNRLFLAGEWHRRFRKGRRCYGLISASRDGAWLETFYGWAGIGSIRGSRNNRGTQAVKDLVRALRAGNDVGITPDGSRGPRYEAKHGAFTVARLSKRATILLNFRFSRAIRLNSWDAFAIPMPFSRVFVSTKILPVETLLEQGGVEDAARKAQKLLLEMTDDRA